MDGGLTTLERTTPGSVGLTGFYIGHIHQIQVFHVLVETFQLQDAGSEAAAHYLGLWSELHVIESVFSVQSEAYAHTLMMMLEPSLAIDGQLDVPHVPPVQFVA